MDKTAIKPDFFFKQLPSLQEADREAEKKGATDDERALYAMSQGRGWVILRDYILDLYNDLNQVNKNAITSGSSLEEIGRNTIVVSLTQDILDKTLNKVSDAIEACETNVNEQ